MNRILALLAVAAVGLILSGCGVAVANTAAKASSGSLNPLEDYRIEKLREALRGLSYEGGKVTLSSEARSIAQPGTVQQAMLEFAKAERAAKVENDLTEAIRLYTRGVIINQGVAQIYEGLGIALMNKNQRKFADAAFATALSLEPQRVSTLERVAQRREQDADIEGARKAYVELLKSSPKNGAAHSRLAVLSYYTNNDADAWKEIRIAESLGATVPPQLKALLEQRSGKEARP